MPKVSNVWHEKRWLQTFGLPHAKYFFSVCPPDWRLKPTSFDWLMIASWSTTQTAHWRSLHRSPKPDIDSLRPLAVDRDINFNDFHINNQLRFCLRENSDFQTGRLSIKINLLFFALLPALCVSIFVQFGNISYLFFRSARRRSLFAQCFSGTAQTNQYEIC